MGTKKDSTIYDVAIYCRLSKEDLKEDGDRDESASIGTQKAILTDYVRQRGLAPCPDLCGRRLFWNEFPKARFPEHDPGH